MQKLVSPIFRLFIQSTLHSVNLPKAMKISSKAQNFKVKYAAKGTGALGNVRCADEVRE